jgi:hypothetical protein
VAPSRMEPTPSSRWRSPRSRYHVTVHDSAVSGQHRPRGGDVSARNLSFRRVSAWVAHVRALAAARHRRVICCGARVAQCSRPEATPCCRRAAAGPDLRVQPCDARVGILRNASPISAGHRACGGAPLAIAKGLESDMLVTSGNMGEHDLVRNSGLGVEEYGRRVRARQASRPRNRTLVFRLPEPRLRLVARSSS